MKRLLLLCSVAALSGASLFAQTAETVRFAGVNKRHLSEAQIKNRAEILSNIRRAATTTLWRPGSITNYYWGTDETGSENWQFGGVTKYEYNSVGDITKWYNEGASDYKEYTYDSENRVTCLTTYDNNGTPYSRQEISYDDVVKDLVVKILYYEYENGNYVLRSGEQTVITRNSDGNISKIVTSDYDSWSDTPAWEEDGIVEITYGDNKKATTIKMSEYDEETGKNEVDLYLTDIIWDATDGQIIPGSDDYELFLGANRIKSATAPKEYNYPYAGNIYYLVEYKANDGGYVLRATMNDQLYMSTDYTLLDRNGSYKALEFEIDYDSEDDGTYVPDGPQLDEYTKMYDAYGLVTLDEEKSYNDGDINAGVSYLQKTVGTVTYDSTHGYPLEYVTEFSNQSDDYSYSSKGERKVYGDYKGITLGVNSIESDDNAPVEYYNLQGIRVENPQHGIYIRRQGNKATKVAL